MHLLSILVRVFDGEAPYLQSFIDHHKKIGINNFYFLTDPSKSEICKKIIDKNNIDYYDLPRSKNELPLPDIESKYLAVIDADEYLPSQSVEFIEGNNFQKLSMPWEISSSLSNENYNSEEQSMLLYPRGKEIILVEDIESVTTHTSVMKRRGNVIGLNFNKDLPLRHYYLRGINDLIFKSIGNRSAASSFSKILNNKDHDSKSLRLYSTCLFLSLLKKITPTSSPQYCFTDVRVSEEVLNFYDLKSKNTEHLLSTIQSISDTFESNFLDFYIEICKSYFRNEEGLPLQQHAKFLYELLN